MLESYDFLSYGILQVFQSQGYYIWDISCYRVNDQIPEEFSISASRERLHFHIEEMLSMSVYFTVCHNLFITSGSIKGQSEVTLVMCDKFKYAGRYVADLVDIKNLSFHLKTYGVSFPKAFLIRFGILNEGIVKTSDGVKFYIRPKQTDFFNIMEVIEINSYFRYFGIEKGDTVLDLGANIGVFSILAHKYAPQNVICVEADPVNFRQLCKNTELNNMKSVLINKAVWNKDDSFLTFKLAESRSTHGSIFNLPNESNIQQITVPTISLESLVKEYGPIDFLKSDIEGAEFDMFIETPKSCLKKIDKLSIEYHTWHPKYKLTDLIALFKSAGKNIQSTKINDDCGILYIR